MKHIITCICFIYLTSLLYAQDNSKVKIVDDYQHITSIAQLLSPFKGQAVFIDMWATWCEPCREEFKYNAPLNSYLKTKNVAILYVSVDKPEQDSLWRKEIVNLNLKGKHVRASQALQNELSTLIWGAPGGFSIPHYLLFDRQGKLLLKDVAAPSNLIELKKQIESKLK